ncbi:hypothetical protein DLM78_16935 [Leptospira stimsonii]|uniref:Uncharacterized protein n=1 Tax=Leptospira stimsonii TaxID=2202203 RepID=A0A8B3CMN7_9LEPT|nr:hypothetical protein DLM78_16935 [Leptospira stimsonii]
MDRLFPRKLKSTEKEKVEEIYDYVRKLHPETLKISQKSYRKRSQFRNFFGFQFSGPTLLYWLKLRIHDFKIGASNQYVANFENGTVYLDPSFFNLSKLEQAVILIHEARHGDGDEFHHVDCPDEFPFLSIRAPESDLEGIRACDDRIDGAYGLGAAFLFEIFSFGLFPPGRYSEIIGMYNSEMLRIIVKR